MSLARLLQQAMVPVLGHDDTEAWDDHERAVAQMRALAPEMAQLLIDIAAWLDELRVSHAGTRGEIDGDDLIASALPLLARFAELDGQAKDTT